MMPGMDGFETLEEIRKENSLPILMFTSKNDSASKVRGLRAGADDYLTKPFDMDELIARIISLIRRYTRFNQTDGMTQQLEFDGLKIDLENRSIITENGTFELPPKEFDLLCFLAENPNRVYTKEELFKEIWDMVGEYMEFTQKNGYFNYKRNEQAKYWMYESINDTLRETFYHNPAVEKMLNFTEQQVLNNEISSFVAAKRMMDLFLENLSAKK